MTKKINMLFDATILARGCVKKTDRTGIFFVAYNILKQLAEDSRFIITLYVHESLYAVKYFQRDRLLSKFPVCISAEDMLRLNISIHKNTIKATANSLIKIIYYLKIIKNHLYLFLYRRDNSDVLKSTDIFFSPVYAPTEEVKRFPHIKQFIILHDTIPVTLYQEYIKLNNFLFKALVKSFNRSTCYFCNSECTKSDFLKYYSSLLDTDKMIVIYLATSRVFYPDYDKLKLAAVFGRYKRQYRNEKYIFSLCTLEPRKNLIFTVQCFIKFITKHQIQDLFFYLGGAHLENFVMHLKNQVPGFDACREKIIHLGYVDDNDVNTLYSNSLFFTYISQYEGFGLPPLEAMQAGTPVITSNNSSLPEVVGDAAIMIDYNSEEQCIKAFEDLYFNDDLRRLYINKGLERAKLFSWKKTVDAMTDVMLKGLTDGSTA